MKYATWGGGVCGSVKIHEEENGKNAIKRGIRLSKIGAGVFDIEKKIIISLSPIILNVCDSF